MADRSIVTRLRAEIGSYKSSMDEAAKATRQLGDEQDKTTSKSKENASASEEAAKKSLDSAQQQKQAWSGLGASLLAVGTGITALGVSMLKTGVEYNTLQQTARASLTTLLGSATAANEQMDKLDEFARTSPFSKAVFIQAQRQMLAFGIETQKVIPYLDAIQNAVAASGGGNDDIAGIAATMSKIQSSAKITAEDLNELGGRGVNAAELIGSQMNMTGAQVREAITSGSLDAGKALDALTAGMSAKFEGASDNVKNTFTGAMDRVMAAWRDLSSALAEPFVGKEGGGLFTGLLNETADVMRMFEDLPGPVRGGIAVLGGLVGVAALASGAFLTFAPRIQSTREAMDKMSPSAQRAYRTTSNLAIGAGKAVAALTALSIAGSLINDTTAAGVEKWTSAILSGRDALDSMAKGSADNWLGLGPDGLAGTIRDANAATGAIQSLLGVINLNPRERGANEVAQFDAALSKLVQQGNLGEAEKGAKLFSDAAKEAGLSTKETKALLPQYEDALAGVDNAQQLAVDSTQDLSASVEELEEQWRSAADAAIGMSDSQIAAAQALADANEAAKDGLRVRFDEAGALDLTTEKSREAQSAINDLAAANLANVEAMVANGATSATLDAALATQRESFIKAAESMGYTREQAIALADQYGQIPQSIPTTVNLTKGPGFDAIYSDITSKLNAIPGGKTFTALLNFATGQAPVPRASGGPVFGPGTGTSDSIPALLSNGEHVLTAAEVRKMGGQQKVYAFRQSLNAYAAGGAADFRAAAASSFASGGAVSKSPTYAPTVQVNVQGRPSASDRRIGQIAGEEAAWRLKQMGGVG